MRFYVFDDEDDLVIKTNDEGKAMKTASYYNGYVLTYEDMVALNKI